MKKLISLGLFVQINFLIVRQVQKNYGVSFGQHAVSFDELEVHSTSPSPNSLPPLSLVCNRRRWSTTKSTRTRRSLPATPTTSTSASPCSKSPRCSFKYAHPPTEEMTHPPPQHTGHAQGGISVDTSGVELQPRSGDFQSDSTALFSRSVGCAPCRALAERPPLVGSSRASLRARNWRFLRELFSAPPAATCFSTRRVLTSLFLTRARSAAPPPHMRLTPQGETVEKDAFVIFFAGKVSEVKIHKICDSFSATRYRPQPTPPTPPLSSYDIPERASEQNAVLSECRAQQAELAEVLTKSLDQRAALLGRVTPHLTDYLTLVLREKLIFHTMNMLNYDMSRKALLAEVWIPSDQLQRVQMALKSAAVRPPTLAVRGMLTPAQDRSGAQVPSVMNVIKTKETPPTHFKVNKFTSGFQDLVNAYGIAHYKVPPSMPSLLTPPPSGAQPRRVRHRHLPLPLRRHVRRLWPRHHDARLRPLFALPREGLAGPQAQRGFNPPPTPQRARWRFSLQVLCPYSDFF
jgi:hypothetical protein